MRTLQLLVALCAAAGLLAGAAAQGDDSARHALVEEAMRHLEVVEVQGRGAHPAIVDWLGRTTLPLPYSASDETPWCAAAIGAWLEAAGFKRLQSAAARDYSRHGDPVRAGDEREGDIAVFQRDGPSRTAPQGDWPGHVAVVLAVLPNAVLVVGGNQPIAYGLGRSDRVSVIEMPRERLVAVRRPIRDDEG